MIPPLFAVLAWPLAAIPFFRTMTLSVALTWCLVAGYLFLPTRGGINLPALPTINKDTMPSLVALAAILILKPGVSKNPGSVILKGWLPQNPIMRILVFALIASAFLTVMSNQDAVLAGNVYLSPLRVYDGLSAILGTMMMIIPFLIARRYLASPDQHKNLLRVFCASGLIYSVPIVYEVIMSPQLNMMIYGYFPHSWRQHIRGNGYRPIVFLHHGLWLAIFMAGCILAAFSLLRSKNSPRKRYYLIAALWLLFILVACRSLGALVIVLAFLPVLFFLNSRSQVVFAAIIAGLILIYPSLRGAGLIPVDRINNLAASISEARSGSFRYRLINEDILLEKANKRPLFGWGGWGRSFLYNEDGKMTSIPDGFWVIVIGRDGWIGYICTFGLLCGSIIILALRRKHYEIHPETAGLCLIMAAYLVDLIPNATLTPMTWMVAGALVGRLELMNQDLEEPPEDQEGKGDPDRVRYSRFPQQTAARRSRTHRQAGPHSRTRSQESPYGS